MNSSDSVTLHTLVCHVLWSKLHFEWIDLTDLLSMQNFVKSWFSHLGSTASLHYIDIYFFNDTSEKSLKYPRSLQSQDVRC